MGEGLIRGLNWWDRVFKGFRVGYLGVSGLGYGVQVVSWWVQWVGGRGRRRRRGKKGFWAPVVYGGWGCGWWTWWWEGDRGFEIFFFKKKILFFLFYYFKI